MSGAIQNTTSAERVYGLRDWSDQHGNTGTDVLSRHDFLLQTFRAEGLLEASSTRTGPRLHDHFHPSGDPKRRVFVVLDGQLPASKQDKIEQYFLWAKKEALLDDFYILPYVAKVEEKTLQQVITIVTAAKKFGLKRRDLLLGIGPTTLTDLVGFGAAMYRRSAAWLCVPTDKDSIIAAHDPDRRISVDHVTHKGSKHPALLAFWHPPLASFYDLDFSDITDEAVETTTKHSWDRWYESHYHVSSVPNILSKDNKTLIQDYCGPNKAGRKQKILLVADDYSGNQIELIQAYFQHYGSSIEAIHTLPVDTASCRKNVDGVNEVLDAAVAMDLAKDDLFLVVGGGTIMDIVGFAASMYKGGSRYLKVPTTLLGMIDAGIAVKVGVNLGDHKNFIGRYHAPVACLNDAATFLTTLPQREFSAGLAEAIKMALLKSSHLFDLISLYDYNNVGYNKYTNKIVHISVYTMLEELQPNLFEHDLRRNVDFGHEFGHIIEGLAHHQIPHGECVAIGMAIASWISYLKGRLAWKDLKKILDLSLDLGLPIYATDYDCCNPQVLWEKIRSDGISQKNGKLWLVVPVDKIGAADFIDEIHEIDAAMVRDSLLGLQRYAAWYNGRCFIHPADGSAKLGPTANRTGSLEHSSAQVDPMGIRLPVAEQTRGVLQEALARIQATILQTASDDALDPLQQASWSVPLIDDCGPKALSPAQTEALQQVFARYPVFGGTLKGVFIRDDGVVSAQFDAGSYPLESLRSDVSRAIDLVGAPAADHGPSIALGRIRKASVDASKADVIERMIEGELFNSNPAELQISHAIGPAGQAFSFSASLSSTPDSMPGTPASAPGSPESAATSSGVATPLPIELPDSQKVAPISPVMSRKSYVLTVDVGATNFRVAVLGPGGQLEGGIRRFATPSRHLFARDPLDRLQGRLLECMVHEIEQVRASYVVPIEEVAVSFGAVIDSSGIIQDASVLWGQPARGFDLKLALESRLPGARLTVLNDISAAAWRYKDSGRFCLVTVSSGLSNKVFNPDLKCLDRLDLDAAGIGGEMGHVVVEPRAVDALVQLATTRATSEIDAFKASHLYSASSGNPRSITARHLRAAIKEEDAFAVQLLHESEVPLCPCGNLADLCSYSSGRAALINAKKLAAQGLYNVRAEEVTDVWLARNIDTGHALAVKVLQDATYPLALRILQLAADIGLNKFIIVGGFAMKTGRQAYLSTLQNHLVRLCHDSAYFADWPDEKLRSLVQFGVGDDNDGLLGIGYYVQHLRLQYRAVEKAIGESSQEVVSRTIPRCGKQEVLAKVLYSGICTTDLEILRGQRGYEPTVLGHEGVCQVVKVGSAIAGLKTDAIIIINPNNPLDDFDKLGHTKEGVFQQYVKFGQESLDRNQILVLSGSTASPTDTLIEPLSCVLAAQELVPQHVASKNILVIGAGVMGLMFALMAQKNGAASVLLANRSEEKLRFAVAKGVVSSDKAFAADNESIAREIEQRTLGEGVQTVFICVGNGNGEAASQAALDYVSNHGCVYLFSGFRGGDRLTLSAGQVIDILPLRAGWKTPVIQHAGKSITLGGNRGSRVEHLEKASHLIRQDGLFFSKVISHIVSIDTLPETMASLAKDRKVLGQPAKRVVIDMEARDGLTETADTFAYRQLQDAARRRQDAISSANLFKTIGFDGTQSQLGWVLPPAWHEVESLIKRVLGLKSFKSKEHFIFCGTGPWAWVVDALKGDATNIHTIDSLDPEVLRDLTSAVDISRAAVVGISQSGTTLETVTLMNTLRKLFESQGLHVENHFAWMTDASRSIADGTSGESTVKANGWDVDIIPLTIGNYADINALFCGPHSSVALVTLLLSRGPDTDTVQTLYQQYLGQRQLTLQSLLVEAYSVASNGSDHIQLILDYEVATPAMGRLMAQLFQQALGSKQRGFSPRLRVSLPTDKPFEDFVRLPIPSGLSSTALRAMLAMDSFAVFVACVAFHRRMDFVTHPQVNRYKARSKEILKDITRREQGVSLDIVEARVSARLRQSPDIRFVDVIIYGESSHQKRKIIRDKLTSRITSLGLARVSLFNGGDFNHSAYQAAVQKLDTLFVVLDASKASTVEGIPEEMTESNIRLMRAIARATGETLDMGMYFVI